MCPEDRPSTVGGPHAARRPPVGYPWDDMLWFWTTGLKLLWCWQLFDLIINLGSSEYFDLQSPYLHEHFKLDAEHPGQLSHRIISQQWVNRRSAFISSELARANYSTRIVIIVCKEPPRFPIWDCSRTKSNCARLNQGNTTARDDSFIRRLIRLNCPETFTRISAGLIDIRRFMLISHKFCATAQV